jgi:hypothetical protein
MFRLALVLLGVILQRCHMRFALGGFPAPNLGRLSLSLDRCRRACSGEVWFCSRRAPRAELSVRIAPRSIGPHDGRSPDSPTRLQNHRNAFVAFFPGVGHTPRPLHKDVHFALGGLPASNFRVRVAPRSIRGCRVRSGEVRFCSMKAGSPCRALGAHRTSLDRALWAR